MKKSEGIGNGYYVYSLGSVNNMLEGNSGKGLGIRDCQTELTYNGTLLVGQPNSTVLVGHQH